MEFLFFIVHPSKFHVFRSTINTLKSRGHTIDIVITSKDVLESLIKSEGWNYTNIFPQGRKIKGLLSIVSSAVNFPRTICRLFRYTKGKKYDLLITDDLLVYVGKRKKIPSIVFCDDDLSVVRKFSLVLSKATHVLAPEITDLGRFNKKKIGFPGYKELAYLHPNVFKPNADIIKAFNPELKPYFVLRLVSLAAYHDVGMKGISNNQVKQIIETLEERGLVFITSERELPAEFEKYRLKINPADIAHILYYAQMFIGDSQTMTSEAALLGTPAFRCNDFAGKISVMEEKEVVYGLSFNYSSLRFDEMHEKIKEILGIPDFKKEFELRKEKMLLDKIDLSSFMIWLFENYKHIDFRTRIDFMKYTNRN